MSARVGRAEQLAGVVVPQRRRLSAERNALPRMDARAVAQSSKMGERQVRETVLHEDGAIASVVVTRSRERPVRAPAVVDRQGQWLGHHAGNAPSPAGADG